MKPINLNKRITVQVLIILFVIGIGILLLYLRNLTPKLALDNAKTFKSSTAKNETGTGMSFILPGGFKELAGDSPYSMVFVQKGHRGEAVRTIIAIRRLFNGAPAIISQTQALKGISSLVPKTTSAYYYGKTNPNFQKFNSKTKITKTLPKLQPGEVGIKPANEIDEDFQLVAVNASPKEVDAAVRYLLGKNTSYYLIVSSQQKTWQDDRAIWEKVLNSMKVDL